MKRNSELLILPPLSRTKSLKNSPKVEGKEDAEGREEFFSTGKEVDVWEGEDEGEDDKVEVGDGGGGEGERERLREREREERQEEKEIELKNLKKYQVKERGKEKEKFPKSRTLTWL